MVDIVKTDIIGLDPLAVGNTDACREGKPRHMRTKQERVATNNIAAND